MTKPKIMQLAMVQLSRAPVRVTQPADRIVAAAVTERIYESDLIGSENNKKQEMSL